MAVTSFKRKMNFFIKAESYKTLRRLTGAIAPVAPVPAQSLLSVTRD